MAKRFTDTNKYKKPFIRGLQGAYKLLWDYLYHECDHAGIWIVDFEVAQIYIGLDMTVEKSEALKQFNKDEVKIIEIDNGKKWFIPSFIEFQYGELNEENRAHNSVIKILSKYNLFPINKPLTSPLQGAMDMVKDKDKDMDKEKGEKFNFLKSLIKLGTDKKVADEFMEVRRRLKAVNTETAFKGIEREIKKSRLTPTECIKISVERSWKGFKAEWVEDKPTRNLKPSQVQADFYTDKID